MYAHYVEITGEGKTKREKARKPRKNSPNKGVVGGAGFLPTDLGQHWAEGGGQQQEKRGGGNRAIGGITHGRSLISWQAGSGGRGTRQDIEGGGGHYYYLFRFFYFLPVQAQFLGRRPGSQPATSRSSQPASGYPRTAVAKPDEQGPSRRLVFICLPASLEGGVPGTCAIAAWQMPPRISVRRILGRPGRKKEGKEKSCSPPKSGAGRPGWGCCWPCLRAAR